MRQKGSDSHSAAVCQSKKAKTLQGLLLLSIIFVFLKSYRLSEINMPLFWSIEGLNAGRDFLKGLFPPDLSIEFLKSTIKPTFETLYISVIGTILGLLLAIPLSLFAASSLTHRGIFHLSEKKTITGRVLRVAPFIAVRGLLNLLRSIPELIWALIFVRVVGLGSLPGILALGVSYAGILGKLYSEILDSVRQEPIEALYAAGASKGKTILYGYLPQALPDLTAYTLYRWECGIRTAMILGFVGAGGIGQEIELSMRMFNYPEVSTLLIILISIVSLVDALSSWIRRRLV